MHVVRNGVKCEVKMTSDGKAYFLDQFGQMQFVNSNDQPKVQYDAAGNAFVMENGEKKLIKINEQGQQYFVNAEGVMTVIRGADDEEYESEDEMPDYVDAAGNCKYCGAKYGKKKHKGGVYVDEKGEKYVLDKWGNKIYLQVNANGQMFYIDANGMMVLIPWGTEARDPSGGWMVRA